MGIIPYKKVTILKGTAPNHERCVREGLLYVVAQVLHFFNGQINCNKKVGK